MRETGSQLQSVGFQLGTVGAGLGAGFAVPIKAAADFEQAIANVKAQSLELQQSEDAFNNVRDAAIKFGEETVFSATEAASAMENLARAGFSAAVVLLGR